MSKDSKNRELFENDFGQVMKSLDNFVFKLKKCEVNGCVFTLITGKLAKELNLIESKHLHKSLSKLLPEDVYEKLLKPVAKTLNGESCRCELKFQNKNLFVTLAPLYLGDEITEIVGSMTDITDLRTSELIVEHMAYHDSLTDLPNRRALDRDLSQLIIEANLANKNVAVVLLDLDHFKHINDTLGHTVGDYILIMAAHRLQKVNLKNIGYYNLYHFGGDEFVFILYDIDENIAKMACDYVLKIFESPFLYKNYDIHLQISMGISQYPLSGDTQEDLLKNADIALSSAKADGRNTYKFYTPVMNALLLRKLQIENDLRKALAVDDQLQLYYQPQVNIETGEIVAVEALIRWRLPGSGMISPLDFIGVAEKTGLIIPLGNWVLKEACTQVKKWHNQGFSTLRMSINISTKHFKEPRFIKDITKILAEIDLAPHLLELEITENSLLDNTIEIGNTLTSIRDLGVQIAIDDFGTGFSSLSYLKTFPITTLKIDQSFVYELPVNKGDRAIVSSIINLAHNLGLRVIAEGVETEAALAFLHQEKCDEIQGYFFSKPIPANELENLLAKHKHRS
ncbi:EAL domain-containing protein [Bacillaceae bacterium IKA-2]|nr:EAL domain-containing protein [Bacillaceae bacterium IKA-2]